VSTQTLAADRPRTDSVGWRRWHLVGLTALTAYSTALGWQAQAASYPLFRVVPESDFLEYHAAYNAAIPLVVIVPGFVGFLAAAAFPWTRPADVPPGLAGVVAASGVGIGQDAATIDSLLDANLLRSALLTAGTVALVVATARSGRHSPTVNTTTPIR
jgi:hypothetical protein